MQKSIIGWTTHTWNPAFGCSKVSDGCKHCYAETLALKYGQSKSKWTIQNETENVVMKPHKLAEPFAVKEASRIFVNSTSDLFHRVIPDWYRAAIFCVMLSTPQHVYQVLTKRPEAAEDWHERFKLALVSAEFIKFVAQVKNKRLKAVLENAHTKYSSPWADHIWMGASIEDARVTHRLDSLRRNQAHVRFVSAEPLLGAWGQVDLSGIDWVIVGGESGLHLTGPEHPRWMQQAWAREIRDLCVASGTAYFYKQDSGKRTEQRPYLVEEDGTKTVWQQYPGDLKPPTVYETGELYVMPGKPDPEPPTPPAPKSEAYECFTVGDRAVRKADGAEFVVIATDGDFISGNRWYTEEKFKLVTFDDHNRSVKEPYEVVRLETIDRVHRKHFRRPEGEWSTAPKPAEVITVITPAPPAQPHIDDATHSDVVVPDGAMAISLWEPYGTLIKVGAKQYETRHWRTGYRGPLVICTAKKRDREILESYKALRPDFFRYGVKMEPCRFGVALCLVDLVDCIPAEFIGDDERRFGNFAPGRFAWLLENVRPFAKPIPVRGHQGLWRWEDPRIVPADAVIPPGIEAPALSPRRVETMPTEEVEPVQLALL